MCRWCQVPPRAAGLAASDSVGTWDLNKNEWPKYVEVKLKYTIWDGIELQALCFSFHFMFFTCFSPTWPTQHQYDLHSLHLHHRGGGLRTCRSCRQTRGIRPRSRHPNGLHWIRPKQRSAGAPCARDLHGATGLASLGVANVSCSFCQGSFLRGFGMAGTCRGEGRHGLQNACLYEKSSWVSNRTPHPIWMMCPF